MTISRRRFLKTAAVAGSAGAVGVAGLALASGGSTYSIQGLDVSSYQGTVNWANVKKSGKTFAFAKATEGAATLIDPKFASNWAAMKTAGLIRGAYHFGHPGTDPVAQAKHFVSVVKPVAGDLQMTLDIETTDGKTPAQVRAWIVSFINEIQSLTGRPGIIYTGYYFWLNTAGNGSNLNCPLWLAAYTSSTTGLVPAAWPIWSFWQYGDTGKVSGITGNVDVDAWNGSLAELEKLCLT